MHDDEQIEQEQTGLRLGDGLRRRGDGPGASAFVASVVLHAAIIGTFVVTSMKLNRDRIEYPMVAINLVSPPPTELGEPEDIVTTTPVVTTPEPEKPVEKKPEPKPKPKPQTQAATPQKVETKAPPKAAKGENPKPVSVGGSDLNIKQDGVAFPFPDYLETVVTLLSRALRPPRGTNGLSAEVTFNIQRDGSVTDVEIIRRSGNIAFDIAALDAVTKSAAAGRIPPLPKDYQNEYLPMNFTFAPKD